MKRIIIVLLLIFVSTVHSQELTWETNIDKAISLSNKTNKPMLLFFTGSDWCGWCTKLQNEVFKTPEFAIWAKENVVLVELDYPKRTAQEESLKIQNRGLQQAFGVQGYPTIWISNATSKDNNTNFEQLGKTGYIAGGPSKWMEVVDPILKNNNRILSKPVVDKPKAKTNKKKKI